jgi:hypothetical protein
VRANTRDQAEAEFTAALEAGDTAAAMRLAEELDRLPAPRPASVLGAALWYARHGIPVFPITPLDKRPYPGTRGLRDATTDADAVRGMFMHRPDANLAAVTGVRFDVIDVDGPRGNYHLATRVLSHPTPANPFDGLPPVYATVSTPRPGGRHFYVPVSGDHNTANSTTGIDYRGRGGYVVVPPSRTRLGRYRFVRPLDPDRLPPTAPLEDHR